MKKILLVFGTRPEAIKMMPIIKELELSTFFKSSICVTSQHDEMLKEVLDVFNIKPDYDLKIMKPSQTLFNITNTILIEIEKVYDIVNPDIVLVHGDTTTAFVSTLAAFYKKIDVGHVEAGLRTNDIYSPYPEEFNRQAISLIAKYHFAPTDLNKENLINVGIKNEKIFVTGNTAIDVLKYTIQKNYKDDVTDWLGDEKLILMTLHRRELDKDKMESIFLAILEFINNSIGLKLLFPVHPNPKVKELAYSIFANEKKVKLTPPLDIFKFHNLINRSHLIVTDSGGIQEEAPSLNVPVIVIRDKTERIEALKAGTILLAGTEPTNIKSILKKIIYDGELYSKMRISKNPYGNGNASKRIIERLIHIYE